MVQLTPKTFVRLVVSIRFRLLVLVVVAVTPAVALTIYTGVEHRRRVAEDTLRATLDVAQSLAREEDRIIDGARQLLSGLTRRREVQGHDAAGCSELFADIVKTFPIYANLAAAKPSGDVFCSAVPLTKPVNVKDRYYFGQALERRVAVSQYLIARTSGKPSLNVAVPAFDAAGVPRAVIFAGVDLARLSTRISDAALPEGFAAFVIDRHGTVLTHYPHPEAWVGKSVADKPIVKMILGRDRAGTARTHGLLGQERLFGFAPLAVVGGAPTGYVAVGVPIDIAFAEENRILRRNLVSLGIAAALTLVLGWLLAGSLILRQIDVLTALTRRLRAGDLSARAGPRYATGEFGRLGRALDTMAESLQQREADLLETQGRLRDREEQYRVIAEAATDAIVRISTDNRILFVNPAAERIFGYVAEDLVGQPLFILMPEALRPRHQGGIARYLETGQRHIPWTGVEISVRHKTGREIPMEISFGEAPIGGQRTFTGILRDISDRKAAEQELQRQREALYQSEKLAALGRLAAGVAHELKNPLSVIEMRLHMLKRHVSPGEPAAQHLPNLAEAGERMKRIMQGLSNYAKPSKPQATLLNIPELLASVRELVSFPARRHHVQIVVDAPAVPAVRGDRSQVMQILLNLALNAVEAMAETGGRLVLRARAEPNSAPRSVIIEVADTGPGIAPGVLGKIWDAFYTTKAEGTGLGLSIVRGLVDEQPGARIAVESTPGEGTRFTLTMPAASADGGEVQDARLC